MNLDVSIVIQVVLLCVECGQQSPANRYQYIDMESEIFPFDIEYCSFCRNNCPR